MSLQVNSNSGTKRPRVLIVGGGIGGLTTAIALRQAGCDVALFERAGELRPLGAGLSLWTNAVLCLRRLGLEEAILQHAAVLERAQFRTRRGDVLFDLDLGAFCRRLGAPTICVHRGALQTVLLEHLDRSVVTLDAELASIEQDADGVTARFADGRQARGDLLVGADGIRSQVRQQILDDGPPRHAGYGGWLGLVQYKHPQFPPGTVFESWGTGRRVGLVHCGGGQIYWFAVRNESTPRDGVGVGGKDDLLQMVDGWHAPVPEVLAATPEESMLQLSFFDRTPVASWSRGRVTLLGDAAHPMTPNLGQGACQAIEDAVALADAVGAGGAFDEMLARYEARRTARAAGLVRKSHRLGRVAQLQNPLACYLRNRFLQLAPKRFQMQDLAATINIPLPRDWRRFVAA